MDASKTHGVLPLFRPDDGDVIAHPEAGGAGYWVGAPTVLHDAGSERWYLAYRRRRPRGEREDRGYETVIAESRDGLEFEEVWKLRKSELGSSSIEKCCLVRAADGRFLYYFSYVDPADNRWRVDRLEADSPAELDVSKREVVFTATSATQAHGAPIEGVKDPNVYRIGSLWYMFLSVAEGRADDDDEARRNMHATGDVYNVGVLTHPSALAVSTDGREFTWRGICLPVGESGAWDSYQARLGSILDVGGVWLGFYDGSASAAENYEERCGLAQSFDLERWHRASPAGPVATVPCQTGSVRYVDAVRIGDSVVYYYEVVREDGAHELRRVAMPVNH